MDDTNLPQQEGPDATDVIGQRPTSEWESTKATLELGWLNNPISRVAQMGYRSGLNDDSEPKLSPKELNAKFPNVEVPFNEPMTETVANDIAQSQATKQRLSNIIERGPEGFIPGTRRFIAGMIPALLDPLNVASFALTGGTSEALLGKAAADASLANLGARSAINAGAGMAGPEAISGVGAISNQEKYTAGDYLTNVGENAALFGGLHYAVPKTVSFLKSISGGRPSQIAEKVAIGQSLSDRVVNVDPFVKQVLNETDGGAPPPDGMAPAVPRYQYQPIDTTKPVSGTFYHGSESSLGDLSTVDHPVLEHNLGGGIYLTDNPQVANGVAARAFSDAPGKVIEGNLKDVNLLDLEKNSPEARAIAEKAVGEEIPEHVTLKEAIENLGAADNAKVDQAFRDAGYDGYRHEGGDYLGADNSPHNIVKLIDPESEKLTEGAHYEPSPEATRQPGPSEAEAAADQTQDPKGHVFYDEDAHNAYQESASKPFEGDDVKSLQEQEKALMDEMKQMAEQGHLDPETEAAMKELMAENPDEKDSLFKSAMNCLIGNLYG